MTDYSARLRDFQSPAFPSLRPAQLSTLEKYEELRIAAMATDIGIELPTGAGKTLIALLIADAALDRGLRVAYLTGTKQLSKQVLDQADHLDGLEVHHFWGKNYPAAQLLDYHQAQAVGVMNYWVYFNTNPRVEPADLIIFDDAHLAEQAIAGMYTLRIPRDSQGGAALYQSICEAILQVSPGLYPSLPAMRDGAAPRGNPPELISFVDWAAVSNGIIGEIAKSEFLANDNSARFVWKTIQHALRRCGVLVGPTGIEIRPYHVPTQTIQAYARSTERVYLSATLGQPGDIQRRLGTRTVVTTPRIESDPQRLGRRTFLFNPGTDAALDDATWQFAIDQVDAAGLHGKGRVAWLCASSAEAAEVAGKLEDAAYTVYRLQTGDDAAVDRWKDHDFAHLVTAGRFDGLDFPDEVCRLVIVPSVPAASTEFERFVVAYLGDAAYMRYRIGQRLTQALGRANRTPTDSAMYLGLDPGFGAILADPAVHAALGSDVQPAISEGLQLHGGSWAQVSEAAKKFWATHRLPLESIPATVPTRTRPGRRVGGVAQVESAPMEVTATTRLWLGAHADAAESASHAAATLNDSAELEHAAFWKYVEAHAYFDRQGPGDVERSRAALESAVAAAPQTAWFVRLQRTADGMDGSAPGGISHDRLFLAWDGWIREAGSKIAPIIASSRQGLRGTHEETVEALTVLGRLCGASANRAAGARNSGSKWAWASSVNGQRRIWSVQDANSTRIDRADINEVVGAAVEEQHLHPKSRVVGCHLTNTTELTAAAITAAANAHVALVHTDAALALYDAMAERFVAYQSASGAGSAVERGQARELVDPRLPPGDWLDELLSSENSELLQSIDVAEVFDR
ncbi:MULTISPECIES: DEAD/DEAH box helicase [unclassified Cryobacterium]|uniref:DEAD/DEAH box helicase n=1 Tax=unclassified Cryobacterium TaxID=2649013 RepID=UPI002AB3F121|nr:MULTISPECIES: DEAD/DEAH box helicase [unclassified Cryobacterium]MDY7528124.1 hypothetical protein [Cryobacterium sp. 10C2]MDY7556127.1 hypothetical protein [Cryobacterium sp. 10C3]MEB0290077.1 hypothetical protein [Cryobacterium sp. 10C2]